MLPMFALVSYDDSLFNNVVLGYRNQKFIKTNHVLKNVNENRCLYAKFHKITSVFEGMIRG
jgi:hypothetical protein